MQNVTYDVYFYEAFKEEEKALREHLPNGVNAGFTWKTIQEAGHEHPPSALISTRTQSQFPDHWVQQVDGILSRSTGYNHLISYKQSSGGSFDGGYLPLYCHRAVAEQALTLWMSLLRKAGKQTEQFDRFERDGLTGGECQRKTLLVVGVGNIGYEVVTIGRGLGMEVCGVDIVQKHEDVSYIGIEEGMQQADIVVAAMNLTAKNRGYFSYELFKRSKKGLVFINVARGELSPLLDLQKLLSEKHLAGLALDVYENEDELAIALRSNTMQKSDTVKAVMRMKKLDNVIFTPHNAFNTREAVQRKSEQSIQQISSYLAEGRFIWQVPEE